MLMPMPMGSAGGCAGGPAGQGLGPHRAAAEKKDTKLNMHGIGHGIGIVIDEGMGMIRETCVGNWEQQSAMIDRTRHLCRIAGLMPFVAGRETMYLTSIHKQSVFVLLKIFYRIVKRRTRRPLFVFSALDA